MQRLPQGLKPSSNLTSNGTAEAVPFHRRARCTRGADECVRPYMDIPLKRLRLVVLSREREMEKWRPAWRELGRRCG